MSVTVAVALLVTGPAGISQPTGPYEASRTSTPPLCPPKSSAAYRERTGCTLPPPCPPGSSTVYRARTYCTPPAGDGSTTRPEGGRHHDDDSGAIVPVVVGLGLIGVLAASHFGSGKHPHGNELPDRNTLLQNGPQLPTSYPVGSFSVKAFAKSGWPIVLDIMPKPRTRTTLDVMFKKRRVSLVVDEDGMQGRHLVKLDMPGDGRAQDRPRPAAYVLHSVYLDIRRGPGDGGGEIPAPIEVYGIGGGPSAVGSVAIEKLTVLPTIVSGGTPTRLTYAAKAPFNHTTQEILEFRNDGRKIVLKRVMQVTTDDVQVGVHDSSWDGRSQSDNRLSPGLHRYQVRGWFTSDDNSWVGAIAPSLLSVQQ
ncbi:MAG: hypothetical protein ACM3YM_06530 [Sphingomonadales bacterium]